MTTANRYRIVIRCPLCGEKYILRGKRNDEGEYETGFKQCVCGNDDQLVIEHHQNHNKRKHLPNQADAFFVYLFEEEKKVANSKNLR